MTMNAIDRVVNFFNPVAGRQRLKARMQTSAASSFSGASKKRPALKSWFTSKKDADGDLNPELAELRSRSRDLERNNPIAHGAVETKTRYVIGTGLRPEPSIDAEFLGLSMEQAEQLQAQILREFNLVAESIEADAARRKTFYQKQGELYHSSRVNGDAFLLLPFFQRGGFPYSTKFQSIEADRICNPSNKADKDRLSAGFETDQYGGLKAVHVLKTHPSKRKLKRAADNWQRVPVFGQNGRRNVLIHSNHDRRASQTRGVPDLAPVIEVLKQAGRYIDAELMASVISSKFTVFIKSDGGGVADPFAPGAQNYGADGDSGSEPDDDPRDLRLGDGLVMELDEGESIETANPGRPNAQFDPFVTAMWKMIGGAVGVPFEILMKHFTASYSASRAALLQFTHYVLVDRADFVIDVAQPYYDAVIAEAVARGRLHMPGFFKDPLVRKAYTRCMWHGPAMGEIDEMKAANAAAKRLSIGITTHERESRKLTGERWDQVNEQRKIEEGKKWKPLEPDTNTEPGK